MKLLPSALYRSTTASRYVEQMGLKACAQSPTVSQLILMLSRGEIMRQENGGDRAAPPFHGVPLGGRIASDGAARRIGRAWSGAPDDVCRMARSRGEIRWQSDCPPDVAATAPVGRQAFLMAETSSSMVTFSLTSTPPASRAAFQLTPQSVRLTLALPSKPIRSLPDGSPRRGTRRRPPPAW